MNTELIRAVKQAKSGNTAAFDEIYRLTERSVYFTALKIVGDPVDAEDIVQETYIKAFGKLSELKDVKAFPKWLNVIAVNLSKNHLTRKRPALFESEEQEQQLLDAASLAANELLLQDIVEQRETERIIAEIIDELPEAQRNTVRLFYYEELPVERIAQVTAANQNTVKSRLNYARKHIKKRLEALAKRGTKLYGMPAAGLLAAFEQAAKSPAAASAQGAGVSTAVGGAAHTGVAVRVAAVCVSAAVTGAGIIAGVRHLSEQPEREPVGVSIVDSGGEDIDGVVGELEALSASSVSLDTEYEAPYSAENTVIMLGVNTLARNEDGTYAYITASGEQMSLGEDIAIVEFIGINEAGDVIVRDSDGIYHILSFQRDDYGGSLGVYQLDALEDMVLMGYTMSESEPYRYWYQFLDTENTLLFELREKDYFTDEAQFISSYRSYLGGEYSYIGAFDNERGCFSQEYLYAVDRSANAALIYQHGGEDMGESVAERLFPSFTVSSATVSNDGFVLMELHGEREQYVLYDVVSDSYTVAEKKYTSLEYADREKDVVLLYDGDSYTICDTSLGIKLGGLKNAEFSGSDSYLLVTDEKGSGYYNIATEEIRYFDRTTYFSNGYSFVVDDGWGYFVDERLRKASEEIEESSAVIYRNSSYIYLESTGKIHQYEIHDEQ